MIVTNPKTREERIEVTREYEEDNEPEGTFYVEKETRLLYEVRFFPEHALVRPAHPDFMSNLEKMDLITFAHKFEEFLGEQQAVRDFLWGPTTSSIEIKRK